MLGFVSVVKVLSLKPAKELPEISKAAAAILRNISAALNQLMYLYINLI